MFGHSEVTVHFRGFIQKGECPVFIAVVIALNEHNGIPSANLGLLDFVRDFLRLERSAVW